MAISSINRTIPGITTNAEPPGKGVTRQGNTTGDVRHSDPVAPLGDGFDAARVAFSTSAVGQTGQTSVVDQLKGASSFEDCGPQPAVALALPDGSAVGAELIDIKGTRSDSGNTGIKTDGEDCSPPTIGEVGVTI